MEAKTTVSRDGVVSRDGAIIGHVKKEMRQGLFATMLGASYSTEGTPYWVPFGGDGTKLADGYDTRKRAVQVIERVAKPLTISGFTTESGWMSDRKFVSASVEEKGFYFGVSRYADESYWVVDYLSTPTSIMPVFSNGSGSRVTRARVLPDDIGAKVTDAAIAAGVWPIKVGA